MITDVRNKTSKHVKYKKNVSGCETFESGRVSQKIYNLDYMWNHMIDPANYIVGTTSELSRPPNHKADLQAFITQHRASSSS